jgi:hypothetical protein
MRTKINSNEREIICLKEFQKRKKKIHSMIKKIAEKSDPKIESKIEVILSLYKKRIKFRIHFI